MPVSCCRTHQLKKHVLQPARQPSSLPSISIFSRSTRLWFKLAMMASYVLNMSGVA